ncbi:MAG: NFACT family protein, partial [Longimicrobiales bacterium]
MSNAIRYDALLVRDLAEELNRTLTGARLDAVFLDRESLRLTLRTRAARRDLPPAPSLLWQLHPDSGHLTPAPEDAGGTGSVQLGSPTTITSVHAPPDERIIFIDLDAPNAPTSAARRIVIELVTNQWNALAAGADERITAVLRERESRNRVLRAGIAYELPARSPRAGATSPIDAPAWHEAFADVPAGERLNALLRFAAYTSPLNAGAIIGTADVTMDRAALDRALGRYHRLVWTAPRTPVLLSLHGRWQPYSRPEPGRGETEPADSLLDAFSRAAARSAAAPATSESIDRALAGLAQRLETVDRRMRRLRAEQAGASTEAAQLRQHADLLLAQLQRVERGAARVMLDDFAGGTVELELDPTVNASANAARLYDAARKRDRAAARIPGLLKAAAAERARIERLAERIRTGEATVEDVAKLPAPRRSTAPGSAPALPYREYRT